VGDENGDRFEACVRDAVAVLPSKRIVGQLVHGSWASSTLV
jgi:hypothetical protein